MSTSLCACAYRESERRVSSRKSMNQIGKQPVYLSIDIDLLDPVFGMSTVYYSNEAPGTEKPNSGGRRYYEMHTILRGIKGLNVPSLVSI